VAFEYTIMTQEQAETIAFSWHYENEYSFYNLEADPEDLEEFLNPKMRSDSVFAVSKDGELIAFLSINKVDTKTIDIGLGMRPDLTGKGNGLEFLTAGMDFIQSSFHPEKITLSVAMFNHRAINLYRKVGFKDTGIFMQDTNGGTFEFLKMEYECD
jgi:ribosomal-protein-alanine N-acetyltransferase